MKSIRGILLFFGLAVLLMGCQAQEKTKPIHDSQGNVVNLKNNPGKLVLVNYWAPWCDSCKQEISDLNQFAQSNPSQVILYGYDFDHPTATDLNQLATKMGISYHLLVDDPTKVLGLSADTVQGLPMTFVYDQNGKLLETLPGPQTQDTLTQVLTDHPQTNAQPSGAK